MLRQSSLAFATATLVALVATAALRRLALASGFIDRPGAHKSHAAAIPYLGGIAIAAATLAGWLFEPRLGGRIAVAAVAATSVALVGLMDDAWGLGAWVRLFAEMAAAAVIIGSGIRAEPFGIDALDLAVTFVWIVGVTNALNLLDNMDGLAGGVAVATTAGTFALAYAGGQHTVAIAAAAIGGAAIGFLAFNVRPASVFMGDAGALFLGFVLAVLVLEVEPVLERPGGVAVPGLLLALPVLDTTVVGVARVRHARPVMRGGRDHLSHRLVALGLPAGLAVAVLVGVQGLLSLLAVLVGRDVLPVAAGSALGALLLVALAAVAARARVYEEPAIGLRAALSRRRRPGADATGPAADVPTVPMTRPGPGTEA